MNANELALIGGAVFIILLVLGFVFRARRKKLNPSKFKNKWQDLQKFLASKETWPLAIITADKLLDEALKKKRLKGKSMGERMVSAQKLFTDNDGVWYAHNLAKKLMDETAIRLKQADVKKSLMGTRQALRDIGALRDQDH
ncbi:MAG TPA: hypothetical protein VLE69_00020 [Candidatus Saccharimonadales bacterium]|nr:hypothetical protein [Candidatus Saccharimonadales bacterium]